MRVRRGMVGGRAEIERFCERMHPRLVGALTLHCNDAELAQEIAQEALTRAWQHWNRVADYDAPEAWVFRVALNLTASRYRRQAAERRAYARLDAPGDDAAWGGDPTDRLVVREAVATLPPRQRAALVLRYFADLPVDEVALAMGCAPGTVKSLTSKAIDSMRARLGIGIEEAGLDD